MRADSLRHSGRQSNPKFQTETLPLVHRLSARFPSAVQSLIPPFIPSFSTDLSPGLAGPVRRIPTAFSHPCQQGRQKLIHRLSTASEQAAVIPQDRFRRVVAGGTGDAAAGMGAGAAMVEALQGPAIIGVAQHRPRREQLVQCQRAVKDVAAQ